MSDVTTTQDPETTAIPEAPPLCKCGCKQSVTRSKRAPYGWNVYQKGHRIYPTQIVNGKKRCTRCKVFKPVEKFSGKKTGRDRLHTWCHKCNAEQNVKYLEKHPDKHSTFKRGDILREYGLTVDDYNEMFTSQNGLCAICGSPETKKNVKYLSVDHEHAPGETKLQSTKESVRGLLCSACNVGLGCFKDDPSLLLAAAAYLDNFNSNHVPETPSPDGP